MTTARVPGTPDSGTGTTSGQSAVRVDRFALGPYQTNCYIVWLSNIGTTGPAPCWIVDASFGPGPLVERVKSQGLSPQALVLTHAHVDHIAGVAEVVRAFPGLPVWIHGAERAWLADPILNLSGMGGVAITAPGPDRELADGDELTLGPTRWRVLHTPGHSPGGVTLYHEPSGLALVGDSLFAGSIGRTDLPGGDHDLLLTSIREKLYTLPKVTRVLPGHGPETTIGRERVSNPYVRG